MKDGGRCGLIVPEGVLFGSAATRKELRRAGDRQINVVITPPLTRGIAHVVAVFPLPKADRPSAAVRRDGRR